MTTETTKRNQVLELVKHKGILRPKDLEPYGIPRIYLSRLHKAGELQKIGRGLYTLPDRDITEHHALAEVCKRSPKGVVCLLSALRFHEITTQSPFETWLAIGEKTWQPQSEYPPLRIVRFSETTLNAGVEEHQIEGVTVRVYTAAKTIADCFKFRNKIGVDVAIEALRECWQSHRCTMDDLWHYAKICRVQNVMRPYLESLTT